MSLKKDGNGNIPKLFGNRNGSIEQLAGSLDCKSSLNRVGVRIPLGPQKTTDVQTFVLFNIFINKTL